MFIPETNPQRKKVRFGLFLIFLFFMPFYEGTCTHDFAAGFPVALVSLEKGEIDTVWQPFKADNPLHQTLGNLGINFTFMMALGLLFSLWFRTRFFQRYSRYFSLSHTLCFIYIFYSFTIGWILFINQFLDFSVTRALHLLYLGYAWPLMYLAGPLIVPFIPKEAEVSALALMPLALTVALFALYWLSAMVSFLIALPFKGVKKAKNAD